MVAEFLESACRRLNVHTYFCTRLERNDKFLKSAPEPPLPCHVRLRFRSCWPIKKRLFSNDKLKLLLSEASNFDARAPKIATPLTKYCYFRNRARRRLCKVLLQTSSNSALGMSQHFEFKQGFSMFFTTVHDDNSNAQDYPRFYELRMSPTSVTFCAPLLPTSVHAKNNARPWRNAQNAKFVPGEAATWLENCWKVSHSFMTVENPSFRG